MRSIETAAVVLALLLVSNSMDYGIALATGARMHWELDWINTHVHLYSSPLHADAVKRNIEKRYYILDLQRRLKELDTDAQNK